MVPPPDRSAPTEKDPGSPVAGTREVEWQLDATDLDAVRHWLERHPAQDGLKIGPLPTQELHDTYLDTADWRIFQRGFALRLRRRQGKAEATLKGLRSARDDVADREEITEPLPGGNLEALTRANGSVGRRVAIAAGTESLRPLFEVRTSRQRYSVHGADPAIILGEIALDETRIESSGGGEDRRKVLRRLEIEAAGSDFEPLERLVERLRESCGLRPSTENKFAAGVRAAALAPPRLKG